MVWAHHFGHLDDDAAWMDQWEHHLLQTQTWKHNTVCRSSDGNGLGIWICKLIETWKVTFHWLTVTRCDKCWFASVCGRNYSFQAGNINHCIQSTHLQTIAGNSLVVKMPNSQHYTTVEARALDWMHLRYDISIYIYTAMILLSEVAYKWKIASHWPKICLRIACLISSHLQVKALQGDQKFHSVWWLHY